LELIQFRGNDRDGAETAVARLDQMQIAVELMRDTLQAIETAEPEPAAEIVRPISDDFIAAEDDRLLRFWAARFGISMEKLRAIMAEVGPSAIAVRRVLNDIKMHGPPVKAGRQAS
jgi:hypothetical protein